MALALFDLDNTLLTGDSDHAWMEFLGSRGIVDAEEFNHRNDQFYADYVAGRLDIHAFLDFQLTPLADHPRAQLDVWHRDYLQERVLPMISNRARALVEDHRQQGDVLVIITATNRFVTAPIATEFGIGNLLATEPEVNTDGEFTGKTVGTPCFQAGKIERLRHWLQEQQLDWQRSLQGSTFYSDSYNDLPLLETVDFPVAVNPDERLRAHATSKGWPILSLHDQ